MNAITRLGLSLATSCAGFLLLLPTADARSPRQSFNWFGGLTTTQVECDTLCTEGPLTGELAGLLEFTMTSMQETSDPNVVRYWGVNTITTDSGTLIGNDYGIWNLATGEFFDFTVFTHGTGEYARVRGTFAIMGTFDVVNGVGSSMYYASLSTWPHFGPHALPNAFAP